MEASILFRIAAVGVIVAVVNQILVRFGREEYTLVTTLAGLVITLMMVLPQLIELFEYMSAVFEI